MAAPTVASLRDDRTALGTAFGARSTATQLT